jgi:NhaP-type Na+/H+ or K+/H+ antiporter
VGLCLALILHSSKKGDEYTKDMVLFATACVAFLSIIINGTTTEYLISFLGISKESPVKL